MTFCFRGTKHGDFPHVEVLTGVCMLLVQCLSASVARDSGDDIVDNGSCRNYEK